MNEYLRASVKRYKEEDSLIAPISSVDAEIFTEIYELSKKSNFKELTDILKKYKYLKDEEIRDKLLQLNIEFSKRIADSKQDLDKDGNPVPIVIRYLKTNNRVLDLFMVVSYDCINNTENESVDYQIKLNPTPPSSRNVPYYSNEILSFSKKKDRDNISEKLDVFLSETRGYFLE